MTAAFSNYSFVQFELPSASSCCPDPAFCLPMSDPANLQFYLYINGLDTSPYSGVDRILYYAYAVPTDMSSPPSGIGSYNPFQSISSTNPVPLIFANHFNPPQGASMMAHFDSPVGQFDSLVDMGECFKLMLTYLPITTDSNSNYVSAWSSVFIGFTNCFQRIDTTSCYTSVLSYSNNSDAFDFQYLWGKPNMVELPMYLRDPVMENDQKVYTKSDGTLVKLYERKEEIYVLETDLMSYAWHKALDIALSQDNVSIQNTNASNFDPMGTTVITTTTTTTDNANGNVTNKVIQNVTGFEIDTTPIIVTTPASGKTNTAVTTISSNNAIYFTKKENYEIEYQKAPLTGLGKGTCKLSNAQAINLINNNCA